jgi:hypothetical protein
MVIHFVRITTYLAQEEVQRIMEERAPRFREVPGLVQKYYGREPTSGAFCGCYIFDSEESRQALSVHAPFRSPTKQRRCVLRLTKSCSRSMRCPN